MLDKNKLKTDFAGLVGFFNFYDPEFNGAFAGLPDSASGVFVQVVHPLCSFENIRNTAPDFERMTYPEFLLGQTYRRGEVVENEGKIYVCVKDMPGDVPRANSSEYWQETTPFQKWLLDIYDGAVIETVTDFLRVKRLDAAAKPLIESLKLFDGLGTYNDRIIKRGRFVGLRLNVKRGEGITVSIDKIGLQLDTVQDLPLYIYHTSQPEPVAQTIVSIARPGAFQWTLQKDLFLAYDNAAYDTGGAFFIGYFEKDLTGQAISRVSSWAAAPCVTCSDWNYRAYLSWSQYVFISAFSIDEQYLTGGNAFTDNLARISYSEVNNWGLNLSLNVVCDLTGAISKNRALFAEAVAMKTALKLLNIIAFSTRINAIADSTKQLAMAEQSTADKESFYNRYLNEVKALTVDFAGMSKVCLPCTNKGIKMGAV